MKTIIFTVLLALMFMFPVDVLSKCPDRWNRDLMVKTLIIKLEKVPVNKWKTDALFNYAQLRRNKTLVTIKEDGSMKLNNVEVFVSKELKKRSFKLHTKIVCSVKSSEIKLLFRILKAFNVTWSLPPKAKLPGVN